MPSPRSPLPKRKEKDNIDYKNLGRSKRTTENVNWMKGDLILAPLAEGEKGVTDVAKETIQDRGKDILHDAATSALKLGGFKSETKEIGKALWQASKDLIAGRHIKSSLTIIGSTLAGGVAGTFAGLFFGGVGAIPGALAGAALGASAGRRVAKTAFPDEYYYDISLSKTEPISESVGFSPETINKLCAYLFNRAQATDNLTLKKQLTNMLNRILEDGNPDALYLAAKFMQSEYKALGDELHEDKEFMIRMMRKVYGDGAENKINEFNAKFFEAYSKRNIQQPNTVKKAYIAMNEELDAKIIDKTSKLKALKGKERKKMIHEINNLKSLKKSIAISRASDFILVGSILDRIENETKSDGLKQQIQTTKETVKESMNHKKKLNRIQQLESSSTTKVHDIVSAPKGSKELFTIQKMDLNSYLETRDKIMEHFLKKGYSVDANQAQTILIILDNNQKTGMFSKRKPSFYFHYVDKKVIIGTNDHDVDAAAQVALKFFDTLEPFPYTLKCEFNHKESVGEKFKKFVGIHTLSLLKEVNENNNKVKENNNKKPLPITPFYNEQARNANDTSPKSQAPEQKVEKTTETKVAQTTQIKVDETTEEENKNSAFGVLKSLFRVKPH